MHSTTLEIGAGALLVSGIVCLGVLLKRTLLKSSRLGFRASILSISDVSSSLLCAVALLFYRSNVSVDHSVSIEPVNSIGRSSVEEERCDSKALLYQQVLFLLPFANAFLSLVSFSANCYSLALGIERRCNQLEGGTEKPRNQIPRRLSWPAGGTGIATPALLVQWLLPALFAGALQLADRSSIHFKANRTMDELACTLAANFPFESCDEIATDLQIIEAKDEAVLWPNPNYNSSEAREIVSRIYEIVRAAVNETKLEHEHSSLGITAAEDLEVFHPRRSFNCAANDRCTVSATFLRVHFFLLLSLLYFLPILASALLLVASHYKCKEIQGKLEVFPDRGSLAGHLPRRIKSMRSFYRLFKFKLLLAVTLWSPLFLQVLFKTFFCANVPSWLMEIAFLASVLYATVRNTLDIAIASKIHTAQAEHEESSTPSINSVSPN